jgi:hypothetical protein
MAQDGGLPGGDRKTTKKSMLNLDQLFGPVTQVPTSVGSLYLYGLRVSDLSTFATLSGGEPIARIRSLLPHIASLTNTKGFKDERPPLTTEEVERLADVEVEKVAEAYAEMLLRGPRVVDDKEKAKPAREPGESATAYLDRLLKHEVQEQRQQIGRMREQLLASTSSIFEQVRKSTSSLGSTLSDFHNLTRSAKPPEVIVPRMDHLHAMQEHAARQARERAEELEMVRLTGKMTAESAQTLKDLAEAATVLLEQMDERDKKADQSTRKQVTIAVWSVAISAALALLALIVSGLAYYQDKDNNAAGDKWQSDLIAAVRDGNRQRGAAEEEIQRLRDQVAKLQAEIARIESQGVASPPSKNIASTARRAASPGSTVPPP